MIDSNWIASGCATIAALLSAFVWNELRAARTNTKEIDFQPLHEKFAQLAAHCERLERLAHEQSKLTRDEQQQHARNLREELGTTLTGTGDSLRRSVAELAGLQKQELQCFAGELRTLAQTIDQRFEATRLTVEQQLTHIREQNGTQLDAMRKTVDEKLEGTLEKRLGESFKLVSERLELVHRGLGEMHTLASGVGDLKRVLTNVKTRGTWGEFQLAALLEQVLTPEQYAANVATNPQSNDRVEFAVRLPGRDVDQSEVWLPIDAKFPIEAYQRLLDATERVDLAMIDDATKELERQIKLEAKSISTKYLAPPHTTDFGVMYLPTESLYAEVLRRPGLMEQLQRDFRVTVAGPTTLAAFLNSLQMGFRTLAIQQRSSEVWKVLGAAKTEFGRFGDLLEKAKNQIDAAAKTIDGVGVRTRAIERQLRTVEELPTAEAPPAWIAEAVPPPLLSVIERE